MRPSVFGLLLPLFLGCSGQNVVAGEEKTKAEQLAASVPAWCETTCSRWRACADSTPPCDCSGDVCDCGGSVGANCSTDCKAAFDAFTTTGEACAVIGERLQKCLDGVTCSDLSGSDPCPVTSAERAACPDPNHPDQAPTATGPNLNYAGAANLGGNDAGASYGGLGSSAGYGNVPSAGSVSYAGGSYGGSGSTGGPAVSCSDSYGAGGGQPQGSSSQVTCEEGRDGCSDGHAYSWVCATDSQGHRACSCFVDMNVTEAFAPAAACPTVAEVNAGCGWNLTQ